MDPTRLSTDAQHVTMRAGSLLLWRFELPHGSTPNASSRPRVAQFLKVATVGSLSPCQRQRREQVLRRMVAGAGCGGKEQGLKMLGARSWDGP
mmetsp:Transcript_40455/g.81547  ORF Transcript_40455/g.81547 Transcript_40455/m.81547 type:complete len:93 (+) Transcript_40455:424-702(+)|eukprot:CAMPEP_0202823512 /NCGR_PEP_ID=MMETSP1389-20130828/11745_1 /ASSEMBLY_ACC=CAM_ASM_000865 /TAXON_ID=302021 /ORGANISM="Rhodomonas sp., Strain CCMP768" /LENGTH=92 /DNA_ID=CAMNT_0049496507 /DNA_START=408 /DNA_END=686 /DNA_ORIENTATION=-